jgi:alpha-1,3-mannosyltransferase
LVSFPAFALRRLAQSNYRSCGSVRLRSAPVPDVADTAARQVALGAPFLIHDAKGYLGASFNLGRTFKHHWSVNFRWVPCELLPPEKHTLLTDCDGLFTSKAFGLGLLLAMVALMLAFAHFRWCERGLLSTLTKNPGTSAAFTENQAAAMLFACNFIGVVCARSLHFQFYVWYYHTLPFLLWSTRLPVVARLLLLLGVELAWNPWVGDSSTPASSALLTACHVMILLALWDGLAARSAGGTVSGGKAKAP